MNNMDLFDDFDRRVREEEMKSAPLEAYEIGAEINIPVIPKHEIMYKEDSGFGIYVVENEAGATFSIKGNFIAPLVPDQTYMVEGEIAVFRNEKQIKATTCYNIKPVNERGIIAYLQTLKGLKSKAHWIYSKFGSKSIDILMETPMLVANSISGIGKKSVLDWKEQLDCLKESQYAMSKLFGYGLSLKQAKKLYDVYKEDIIYKIEENPYFLSQEVKGYGFDRCDKIARNIGFDLKSEYRIREGIIHVMDSSSNEGHCFLPEEELVKAAISLLNVKLTANEMKDLVDKHKGEKIFQYTIGEKRYDVNYAELEGSYIQYKRERKVRRKESFRFPVVTFSEVEILNELLAVVEQKRLIVKDGRVYLYDLFFDEIAVAKRVVNLAQELTFAAPFHVEKELDKILLEKGITLEEKQRAAAILFAECSGGFYVLNGSAGCGKTFTLKIILDLLRKRYQVNEEEFRIKVFAPTGKAAKVASRSTGIECMTVHRGLKYNPMCGFEHCAENPLEAECIVVDETSMLDISLTRSLLEAIQDGTKVIFLGDTKQLPSVGPGNVLNDLIDSGVVKIVTLDVVKRQDGLSGIIRNANRIINQEMIKTCDDTKDAYVIPRSNMDSVQRTIIESVYRIMKMPEYSFNDIQILCPQKTSLIGTYYMNYLFQKEFNPIAGQGLSVLSRRIDIVSDDEENCESINLNFYKGDKVIHVKNNYDIEWYDKDLNGIYIVDGNITGITNGECGVIEDIVKVMIEGKERLRIVVNYEDKFVFYDDGYDELELAYALTIHKSQGSQWKAVIIPLMNNNYNMLYNNLFYTGYTRAEKFSVVVGQTTAIERAIATLRVNKRYTTLCERITESIAA